MRRVALLSCLAAAFLLLLPWQICDCSEDGPHLKLLWDRSDCPDDQGAPDGEGSEEDCDELFFVVGSPADAGAVLAPPSSLTCILPDRQNDASDADADDRPRILPHGPRPPAESPVIEGTRLLV